MLISPKSVFFVICVPFHLVPFFWRHRPIIQKDIDCNPFSAMPIAEEYPSTMFPAWSWLVLKPPKLDFCVLWVPFPAVLANLVAHSLQTKR